MNLALIGFGNVGRPFARLLEKKRSQYPFRIVAVHTAQHGTAYEPHGITGCEPRFGPAAASIEEFLDRSQAEVVFEITPLRPSTGEPAISHIRAAFARGLHVVTANKGPIAHAYAALRDEAVRAGVLFRYEPVVMDGTPIFNMVRASLPAVDIRGFAGVLNSTSTVVLSVMERGGSFEEGVKKAQEMGIAEADPSFDLDGWDSAAKTASLANVLMDARTTPLLVDTKGIGRLTPEKIASVRDRGKVIRLVSRAHRGKDGIKLRVRAEVLESDDLLASVHGTSNMLVLQTDLMGEIAIASLQPGVDQTAYGLFTDLVDIAKSI